MPRCLYSPRASRTARSRCLGVRGFERPGDLNSRILLMIDGHRLNDNLYSQAQIGTEFKLDLELTRPEWGRQ